MWKSLPRNPNFRISSDGRVQKRGLFGFWYDCHQSLNIRTGYLSVRVGNESIGVHRLVLEAFRGPCPPGHETRHHDGDKQNNSLDNLSWATHKKNCEDERKLTPEQAGTIFMLQNIFEPAELSDLFNVSLNTVYTIQRKAAYGDAIEALPMDPKHPWMRHGIPV
jgi:hypothetical protein